LRGRGPRVALLQFVHGDGAAVELQDRWPRRWIHAIAQATALDRFYSSMRAAEAARMVRVSGR